MSQGNVDQSVQVTQVAIEGIDGTSYFLSVGEDGSGLTVAPDGTVFYVVGPSINDYLPVNVDANTLVMVEGILTCKTHIEDGQSQN